MEQMNMEELIRNFIEDLKEKSDFLNEGMQAEEDSYAEKANSIREKTMRVFKEVGDRLMAVKDGADEEQLLKTIGILKEKSEDLYEHALEKIDELKKEGEALISQDEEPEAEETENLPAEDETEKAAGQEENEPAQPEEKEETVSLSAPPIRSEISEKTLEILNGWLMPEREDE